MSLTPSGQHSDATPLHHPAPYPIGTTLRIEGEILDGTEGHVVLMGGSPLRLLRLRAGARAVVERWQAGAPIASGKGEQRLAERLVEANIAHPLIPAGAGPSVRDVTIVIPVHNRAIELDALLSSFGELAARVGRVLVVDDGSTDETGRVARRHGATVIRRDAPSGPGGARNAAIGEVATSLIAFIDSDCIAAPGWLDALLPHFADDQVAIVAPRIESLHDPSTIGRYESVRSSLDLGARPALVRPGTRVSYVPAAALVVRTDALRTGRGFEATMAVGEDVDLIWRTVAAGGRVRYEPDSVVHHRPRTTLRPFAGRRYAYGSSAGPLDHRHRGRLSPMVLSPWSAAAWAAVATTGPLGMAVGVGIAAGSAAALPKKLRMVADPTRLAWRLAARGHLGAGEQLARSLWRTYLPLTILALVISRRARRVGAASLLVYLFDWRRDRQASPDTPALLSYVGLRILDDGAYCLGVWRGCADARAVGPLTPRLQNWPGRRPAAEDGAS